MFEKKSGSRIDNETELKSYLELVEKEGIEPFKLQIFSAHQVKDKACNCYEVKYSIFYFIFFIFYLFHDI